MSLDKKPETIVTKENGEVQDLTPLPTVAPETQLDRLLEPPNGEVQDLAPLPTVAVETQPENLLEPPVELNDAQVSLPEVPARDKNKKPRRRWLWIALVSGIATMVLAAGIYFAVSRSAPKIDLDRLTVAATSESIRVRITASGTVVPVQSVNISPTNPSRLVKLLVKKGDRIQAGQQIALMENDEEQAQFFQARANLAQAQARLAAAQNGTRPEEIEQGRARLAQAQASLRQALNGSRSEEIEQGRARLAQAQASLRQALNATPPEIAQAQARLRQAQASLAQALNGSRPEEINQARARLVQARARVAQLQNSREQEIGQAQSQLEAATSRTNLSRIRLSRYQNLRQQGAISQDKLDEVSTDYQTAQASQAEAQKRLAQLQTSSPPEILQQQAAVAEAQQALQQLQNGTRSEEIAQRQAAVAEAQQALQQIQNVTRPGDIAQKQAAVAEAQQALQQLQNGTRPEEIAQRRADVAQAQAALQQSLNGKRPEEIDELTAAAAAARAQLQSAQVKLQQTVIRAPFEGVVTQEYATEGAFVTPTTSASSTASATSTAIIALARDLEIKAQVPEVDIGQIKVGQPVEIVADAYPDRTFKGTVRLVSPEAVVEQNVTSFEVRVKIDTGKEQLRSGMNIDVTFLGEETNNSLVVPTVAIYTRKGQTGVLIPDKNNQPQFQPVTIGPTIQDRTQILEGIKAGDRVFIETPKGWKSDDSEQ
jgi:HlyD family secretion protein